MRCIQVFPIFGNSKLADWAGILKNFNHDELVMAIIPRERAAALRYLSAHSIHSSFIYWVIVIFYRQRISFVPDAVYFKDTTTKSSTHWGEITANKTLTGFKPIGFLGDLYNSVFISLYFVDFLMLAKLLFSNRVCGTNYGGFYGKFKSSKMYYTPGPLVNILIAPVLILGKFLHNTMLWNKN